MSRRKDWGIGAAALVSAWVIAFAGSTHAATLIKVDGSSTVYPITEAVAEEFRSDYRGNFGHGRRVQEVLQRRNRHRRRVTAHQTH
jgi:hypothetical protein